MLDRKKHVEELIDAAQMLRRKAAAHKGKTADITGSQWLVIGHVSQHEGVTTNDVAVALKMSGSAVTQLVNGLVRKGFIQRQPNPSDKRAHRLMLSAESKKRIASFKKERVRMMLKMFAVLSDREFTEYVSLNKKILSSIRQ